MKNKLLILFVSLLTFTVTACGGKSLDDAYDPETNTVELCDLSENGLVDFVGGAATGGAVTALVAGQSVAIIATAFSTAIIAAPAIDPTLTGAVLTVSALYGSLKAWCHRDSIMEIARDVKNYSGQKVKVAWDASTKRWKAEDPLENIPEGTDLKEGVDVSAVSDPNTAG